MHDVIGGRGEGLAIAILNKKELKVAN